MGKRADREVSAPQSPEYTRTTIPSPTTQDALDQQNKMKDPSSENILFPKRHLPKLPELDSAQEKLVDAFLHLNRTYRNSEWYQICDTDIAFPPLNDSVNPAGDDVSLSEWLRDDPRNIGPLHCLKVGACMVDPLSSSWSDAQLQKNHFKVTNQYITHALLRDAVIALGSNQNLSHQRKARALKLSKASPEDAYLRQKIMDVTFSPHLSDLDDHTSNAQDTDTMSFSSDEGNDAGKDQYEDYF